MKLMLAMKKSTLGVAIAAGAVFATVGFSSAAMGLASAPLKGGAGGLVCSCSNVTGENDVPVNFRLRSTSGTSVCGRNIDSASTDDCWAAGSQTRMCYVVRTDGLSLSQKAFLCTLSSIDAAGNPTATVPVDVKAAD